MLTERQRKRDTPRHWFLCWCSLQQLTKYLHGLEMMHSKSRKGDSMHDKQSINIWSRIRIAVSLWAVALSRRAARNRAARLEAIEKGAFSP